MDNLDLLSPRIEDRYLRALLEYKKIAKLTQGVIEPSDFTTRIKASLFKALIFYFNEFGEVPTCDIVRITIESMYSPDRAELVLKTLDRIYKIPPPDFQWIIAQLDKHIQTIKLRKSLFNAAKRLDGNNLTEAQNELVGALRSPGLLPNNASNELQLKSGDIMGLAFDEDRFCFPTRIYALDKMIHGIYRHELFVILAPLNVGKSWSVIHLAISALLSSKFVLYFTLEMGRAQVLQRMMQNVSGLVKPRTRDEMHRSVDMWDTRFETFSKRKIKTLLHVPKVSKHWLTLSRFGGNLAIREHSSGQATIKTIEQGIEVYDVSFGKLPDVVIVDGLLDLRYVGSVDTNRQRLGLTDLVRQFRALAQEYNCCVILTHQANRQAGKSKEVDVEHTGESIGIMQVADTAISLQQTREDHQKRQIRIKVIRARNQQKWGLVRCWQNLDIGQFCQHSEKQ